MATTLTRWTVADYHHMIASGLLSGRHVELINGKIVDMAPELPIHRATYRRGVKYLEALLKDQAVVFSAAPITLPNDSEPEPDISIVQSPESRYDEHHPGPSDIYWLIEVSNSTLTYDLGEKANLYAQHGIQDYWVIDIANNQLWVHRQPQDGTYQSIEKYKSGTITPVTMPSIEIKIDRLLK
ncbi:Uma2 family endonuclease [Leptolyngbya cf. ectocarpi LEGE 11479]|uniref:Uma2 family endonuclease n=1 Tax=Leptolyngbya cf. ectocarpi LEGE 11479 TaxID=1828722 RepID=A0A928X4C1_LEPEC|nr:Uma2 family endonuclease [Leptolyngbya ectocarpi]MBE9066903.1 Uma2 family endonuclease [Leptolyngbya cf. ectocarpi LEGE 11479]